MSIRKVLFVSGEYYHLYNRGNSKQKIFHDEEDHKRFVGLLYVCNQKENFKSDDLKKDQGLLNIKVEDPIVAIGAYTLMPNHFHILITGLEDVSISKFMQKLTTAYVMYYNKKYKRTGSLFEGKFKSEYLGSDNYLKYIYSYIHLNPLKLIDKDWKEIGLMSKKNSWIFLKKYQHSSFLDYFEPKKRKESKVLNKILFPGYFSSRRVFIDDIKDWITYK